MEIYVMYYLDDVVLVTNNPIKVAECSFNNDRDKLQIWKDGKLIEEKEWVND